MAGGRGVSDRAGRRRDMTCRPPAVRRLTWSGCRLSGRRTDAPRDPDGECGYGTRVQSMTARDGRPLAALGNSGRNETELERCDRNLVELLQEVRVVQTGVQVLFAFLLTAPLAARFPDLTSFQRHVYFVTLLAAGASAVLLIAPTAYHRILFRCGDKE